jgi:hypothetical protein
VCTREREQRARAISSTPVGSVGFYKARSERPFYDELLSLPKIREGRAGAFASSPFSDAKRRQTSMQLNSRSEPFLGIFLSAKACGTSVLRAGLLGEIIKGNGPHSHRRDQLKLWDEGGKSGDKPARSKELPRVGCVFAFAGKR